MSLKTSGAGYFQIPTEPAAGTSITSGSANAYSASYVQLIASTGAAIYIVGVHVEMSSTSKPTYMNVRLATGGAGSESIVSDLVIPLVYTAGATGTQMQGYVPLPFPIAVATTTRIAAKTADSVGSLASLVTLQCINQSNVVVDVTENSNVLQWNSTNVATPATAGIPEVNVKNINNQATSASGTITFPNATLASTTNITAGTITTATNLTTNNDKTGYRLSATGISDIWQDTTAGDFTTASSIGKSIMNGVSLGTGLTVNALTTNNDKTGYSLAADQAVNATKIGGTTQTGRDLGASVLLSSGTGTGQLDFTSGVVKASLAQILGTAFTEGAAGRIAAAFKQFFNIASPAATMDHGVLVDTATTVTNAVTAGTVSDKTGYSLSSGGIQAIWDALTSALTTVGSIGKLLVTDIDAAISSRSTYAGGDTSGTTTLLGRLTSGRATNLDNLDATVSSRLATSGYTAPDNTSITSIKAKTDNLPSSPAATGDAMTLTAAYNAAKTAAQAGDAMTLTTGERTSVGTAVWASATRTLTSFGTLVADIWAAVVDSSGVTTLISRLTSGRASNIDNLDTTISSRLTTGGDVNVATINGATVAGTGQPTDLWRGS